MTKKKSQTTPQTPKKKSPHRVVDVAAERARATPNWTPAQLTKRSGQRRR